MPESTELMRRLSAELQSLDAGLREESASEINAAVLGLTTATKEVASLTPQRNASRRADFDDIVARVARLSTEIETLNEQGRFGGIAQAVHELRNACVSCHVSFRADNDERGQYPAWENTVSGSVQLFDRDGEEVEDRSWALAFLEREGGGEDFPHLRLNPALNQVDRSFAPRVLPVVQNASIDFPNGDTIFHNVFSLSRTAPFDLGVYQPGEAKTVQMKRTGLVKVYCNIHPDMAASIVVLGNPYYCLTDSAGQFVISGVPDGRYRLRVWNERGANATASIDLSQGEWKTVPVRAEETHRVLGHKNKYGKPYSDDYQ